MNSSQNLPIYLCVGSSFQKVLTIYMTRLKNLIVLNLEILITKTIWWPRWTDCFRRRMPAGSKDGNSNSTSLEAIKKSSRSPDMEPKKDGKTVCSESAMVWKLVQTLTIKSQMSWPYYISQKFKKDSDGSNLLFSNCEVPRWKFE